jgi:Cys-tRNA(Pro) deacylase
MKRSEVKGGWPEPVQRVSDALREAGADGRVEEFPSSAATAEDAARAVGCDLRQIVKSLVFDCDGRYVLVMVPGDRRADGQKVAALTGAKRAKVAGPDAVQAATGYEPGAVSPVALENVDLVLIDKSLVTGDLLWVGAGTSRHMAGLPATELVRVSCARPADVTAVGV